MISPDRQSLMPLVTKFKADFESTRTAFVMMRFYDNDQLNNLFDVIKTELEAHNITALRADFKDYSTQLWISVQTYMLGADYGIAIFDRISTGGKISLNVNPNVSIEAGYMMGLDKDVLLLKDKYLPELPADFKGVLYKSFDGERVQTVKDPVNQWATHLET